MEEDDTWFRQMGFFISYPRVAAWRPFSTVAQTWPTTTSYSAEPSDTAKQWVDGGVVDDSVMEDVD